MPPEPTLLLQLLQVFKDGGPWAFCVVILWLYIREKEHTQKLNEVIISMAVKGTEATVNATNVIAGMRESLKEFIQR